MKHFDQEYSLSINPSYYNETIDVEMLDQRKAHIEANISFSVWRKEYAGKIECDLIVSTIKDCIEKVITDPAILSFDLGNKITSMMVYDTQIKLKSISVYVQSFHSSQSEYELSVSDQNSSTVEAEAKVNNIILFGTKTIIDKLSMLVEEQLESLIVKEKSALVKWIFSSGRGSESKTFTIHKDWEISREFYPWINTDLQTYYKKFVESKSQILVLYGPPGTGKTSFIRDLICETGMNSFISYDLKILTSDSMFVEYLTDKNYDAIVVEDADELLSSNRGDHNKVIAKILNISDGLIKLPSKKLIFTTNLTKIQEIDSAIIRPGRCFDVMEFRNLTPDEAVDLSDHLEVPFNPDPAKKMYSLAEIFYQKTIHENDDPFLTHHGENLIKKTKLGFV